MSPTFALLSVCFYALLSSGTSSGDDPRWLLSLVDLVELDYEDRCDVRGSATWEELIGSSKGLARKLERDKSFGMFSRKQTTDVKSALKEHAIGADDEVLRRRVKLLIQPGDTLLETEQWIRLVTFGDTALNKLRFATDYDCGSHTNCTLRELQYNIARQQDENTLLQMKQSWDRKLPDLNEYLDHILPLLRNASKENEYNTVEEYWDSLGEYEGGLLKAREIWDHVRPLYMKLHKYVALRLKGADAVGKPLAVHSLKSLTGDDWSNLIELLLPKHPDVYLKLYTNLHLKELGGLKLYKEAEKLLLELNFGEIEPGIIEEALFNATCPPTIVNWCKPNKMSFVTCKDISIRNYMEAHETLMRIKHKMTTALHSNNTYVLREASRYSAIYEAIPGFVSLLSLNPHTLNRVGLYPLERFNYNQNHHRLVLQLIIALRDLPKLNYYLAVDEWRLNVLMGKIPAANLASSWSEFRRNFSLIETSDVDILGDPFVLFNKPYIGKFMGLILKYQIFQSFAEELISDDSDLVKHVGQNNARLLDTMMQGYGTIWPEMVSDLLAKRENNLEYLGLTDYFRFLDEYLDNQLDPSTDNIGDDYVEPPVSEAPVEEVPEENEIPDEPEHKESYEKVGHDPNENLIDTGDEPNSKLSVETSTVGVLEIKNAVAAEDNNESVNPKEASYNTYWWIGVGVGLCVVVILVAIIARKRHTHRKVLERQRRNNSRA